MKTPKIYQENLNKKVITTIMLAESVYSSSKRAKNHRDNFERYRDYNHYHKICNRYYFDKYNNEEKAKQKMDEYYAKKDILLGIMNPTAIHTSTYYSTFDIYEEVDGKPFYRTIKEPKSYSVYLYYEFGGRSFHSPIEMGIDTKAELDKIVSETISKYQGLEVTEIDSLRVDGADIADILSVQFTDKVVELVKSGDFTLVDDEVANQKVDITLVC